MATLRLQAPSLGILGLFEGINFAREQQSRAVNDALKIEQTRNLRLQNQFNARTAQDRADLAASEAAQAELQLQVSRQQSGAQLEQLTARNALLRAQAFATSATTAGTQQETLDAQRIANLESECARAGGDPNNPSCRALNTIRGRALRPEPISGRSPLFGGAEARQATDDPFIPDQVLTPEELRLGRLTSPLTDDRVSRLTIDEALTPPQDLSPLDDNFVSGVRPALTGT